MRFYFPIETYFDFMRRWRNIRGNNLAAWPPHPNLCGRFRGGHHLHGAILRPVTGTGVNLASRSHFRSEDQARLSAYAIGISRGSGEAHAQTRLGADVMKQFGLRSVLRHHEIHPTIAIIIGQSATALFAINLYPAFLSWNRPESTFAIALEP